MNSTQMKCLTHPRLLWSDELRAQLEGLEGVLGALDHHGRALVRTQGARRTHCRGALVLKLLGLYLFTNNMF